MRRSSVIYISCLLVGSTCMKGVISQEVAKPLNIVDSMFQVAAHSPISEIKQQASSLIELSTSQELILPVREKVMLFNPVTSLFKGPSSFFAINSIHADINYLYVNDPFGTMRNLRGMAGYDLGVQLSIANMPFEMRIAGSDMVINYQTPISKFPKFIFDHEQYLRALKDKTLNKIKPETVLANLLGKISKVRGQYENVLKSEISKVKEQYESEFQTVLDLPANITDLEATDMASLRAVLLNEKVTGDFRTGSDLQQQLIAGSGFNKLHIDSLQKSALGRIKKLEALEKIFDKVKSWKSKYDTNPLVQELKNHLPFTSANYSSFLNKPGNLAEVIKKQSNISGIQRLFLNVTKLDLGTSPVSAGQLNIESVMNKGVNTEYTGKHSSAGIIAGTGSGNINQWLQAGLTGFVSNEYSSLIGMKIGTGWKSSFQQSLSVNFFDFNINRDLVNNDPSLLQSAYAATPSRRDAVITWQSSVAISPRHKLEVDISKSFGSYGKNLNEDSSVTTINSNKDLLGGQGTSNYAASIFYEGEISATNLQVTLKKAGLGYSNPGSVFVRRGETRIGVSLGRKFLRSKLNIRYKADYRHQYFDPAKTFTYNNFSNFMQLGYRLKRNNRFALTLRHNTYGFNNSTLTPKINGYSLGLQGSANYNFRLFGNRLINYASVNRQTFDMPMINGEKYVSQTWLLTHSSSLLLKKNLVTLTLMMNQSNSSDYYFNTSYFNTELAYAYQVGSMCRFSTGIGYYSNSGWNRQLGIAQQISATVLKKIEVALDISLRKAVQVKRKELSEQAFITSSINYRF